MSIDIAKLTSLPLFLGHAGSAALILDNAISTDSEGRVASFSNPIEAEWHIVARRVLAIQMHRGWTAHRQQDGRFFVDGEDQGQGGYDGNDWNAGTFQKWCETKRFADPFTAIDEAETFYIAMEKAE